MNKKKVILGSTAVAGLALAGGAFALFSDFSEQEVNGTVGTVDISATANIKHTQLNRDDMAKIDDGSFGPMDYASLANAFETAPNNINPGDNIPDKPNTNEDGDDVKEEGPRPGTDHEIEVSITNEGTKSVRTRVLVTLTGTKDGQALTAEQLKNVKVYMDKFNTLSGITSMAIDGVEDYAIALPVLNLENADGNSITYCFSNTEAKQVEDKTSSEIGEIVTAPNEILKAGLVLSGTGLGAEEEKYAFGGETFTCPTTGTFKLDISCETEEAQAELQGADLTFTIKVEGAQYRNTDQSVWETLFEKEVHLEG